MSVSPKVLASRCNRTILILHKSFTFATIVPRVSLESHTSRNISAKPHRLKFFPYIHIPISSLFECALRSFTMLWIDNSSITAQSIGFLAAIQSTVDLLSRVKWRKLPSNVSPKAACRGESYAFYCAQELPPRSRLTGENVDLTFRGTPKARIKSMYACMQDALRHENLGV